MCAGVFGVIWRYCQMSDGKCTASQSKIAEKIGLSTRTVQRCAEKLISAGYLSSVVKEGMGVEYYDTGLAGLRIQVSGYNYHEPLSPTAQYTQNNLRHRVAATYDTESHKDSWLKNLKENFQKVWDSFSKIQKITLILVMLASYHIS